MAKRSQEAEFMRLLQRFRAVKREVPIGDGPENDAEHSYQLATMAWYLASKHNLELNRDKMFRYALIHDLLEVEVGDENGYLITAEGRKEKEQREAAAFIKLQQHFSEVPELFEILAAYSHLADPESRFVYALDKLLPVYNILIDGGDWYQREKVTYVEHDSYIQGRLDASRVRSDASFVALKSILEEIDQRQDEIFAPK